MSRRSGRWVKADEGPGIGSYDLRGARSTAMWMDPERGLVMVILVETFDMTSEEQKIMYGSFMKAAISAYGKAPR